MRRLRFVSAVVGWIRKYDFAFLVIFLLHRWQIVIRTMSMHSYSRVAPESPANGRGPCSGNPWKCPGNARKSERLKEQVKTKVFRFSWLRIYFGNTFVVNVNSIATSNICVRLYCIVDYNVVKLLYVYVKICTRRVLNNALFETWKNRNLVFSARQMSRKTGLENICRNHELMAVLNVSADISSPFANKCFTLSLCVSKINYSKKIIDEFR